MAVHWIIEGSLGPSVWWWGRNSEGGVETKRHRKKELLSIFVFASLQKQLNEPALVSSP